LTVFNNQPSLPAGVQLWPTASALGLVLGSLAPLPFVLAWGIFFTVLLASLFVLFLRQQSLWLIALIACCLTWVVSSPRSHAEDQVGFAALTGTVRHVQRSGWATTITINSHRLVLPHADQSIVHEPLYRPRLGDWLHVTGTWQRNSYNQPRLRISRIDDIQHREDTWRGMIWQTIEQLPHDDALAALLLGAGRPDDRWAFRDAGLLHVLTVSGLHVGIIVMLIWWLSRLVFGPWWLAPGLTAAGTLAFVCLSGAAPPVLRAGIMALTLMCASCLGRRPAPLIPLGLAAWGVWLVDPTCFQQPGTQLSFTAMLGIVTLGTEMLAWRRRLLPLQPWPLDRPTWRGCLAIARNGLDAVVIGGAASLAIWPTSLAWFGSITPWSLVTTAIIVPLLTSTLISALATVVGGAVSMSITGTLPYWLQLPIATWEWQWEFLIHLVRGLSHLPLTNTTHAAAPTSLLLLSYGWFLAPWQTANGSHRYDIPAWLSGLRWGSAAAIIVAYWLRG
jgi:ComEC/Rec2-related protein